MPYAKAAGCCRRKYTSDSLPILIHGSCFWDFAINRSLFLLPLITGGIFSGVFAQKLCRTPDLEALRHKVDVLISQAELKGYLDQAPLMPGLEYLSPTLLEAVWSRLNTAFTLAIKSYSGTVDDFIRTYSPNVHLVGRVFFHLVENKSEENPFAFMATYSTRLKQ